MAVMLVKLFLTSSAIITCGSVVLGWQWYLYNKLFGVFFKTCCSEPVHCQSVIYSQISPPYILPTGRHRTVQEWTAKHYFSPIVQRIGYTSIYKFSAYIIVLRVILFHTFILINMLHFEFILYLFCASAGIPDHILKNRFKSERTSIVGMITFARRQLTRPNVVATVNILS